MIVGGYTLDVYCDARTCPCRPFGGHHVASACTATFTAETGQEARRVAREHGWRLRRVGGVDSPWTHAICPHCKELTPPQTELLDQINHHGEVLIYRRQVKVAKRLAALGLILYDDDASCTARRLTPLIGS